MKKKVAVLFGGRSSEHEISVITGLEIVEALDPSQYEAIPVYIDINGAWHTGEALRDRSFYKRVPASLSEVQEVTLLPRPGKSVLTVLDTEKGGALSFLKAKKEKEIPVDVFFPAFHGQFGEDGCVQGLFEMAGVAYAGCELTASAIAMDKEYCKAILRQNGIPSLPGTVINKKEFKQDIAAVRNKIKSTEGFEEYPLFVKPVHLGSSIAVSRADNDAELDGALAAVFQRDEQAIVEPCITNLLEINVSVLEGEDQPIASVVEVPVASEGTLTYEDKYLRGGGDGKKGGSKAPANTLSQGMAGLTRVIDPEDLDSEIKETVRSFALKASNILRSAGSVRFDFMVDLDTESIYFNELNPLPGSYAFYLWADSSPSLLYTEMLDVAVKGALRRHAEKQGLKRDEGLRALA